MKIDKRRADVWYLAISEFLEANSSEEDAKAPGTLISALCKVMVDAMEGIDVDPQKKVEIITGLTVSSLGLRNPIVIIKYPPDNLN